MYIFSDGDERIYQNINDFISKEIIDNSFAITRKVYEIPSAFDIETSSWQKEKLKFANMYIWQFGFNGAVIYGRTWDEFINLIYSLKLHLGLSNQRKLIVYVHNLSYEFQFIRKRLNFTKVFTQKKRRPIYAETDMGFIFKCSFYLSNSSLALVGKNLQKYKIEKKEGFLDYSLIRNSKTNLTHNEIIYSVDDVRVVMAYIQEKMEEEGSITKIPLTNTGYVRRYVRDKCFYGFSEDKKEMKKTYLDYKALISQLTIASPKDYKQLKRCFMGGFTHANVNYSNKIITSFPDLLNPKLIKSKIITVDEPIAHKDIASSYPKEICTKPYPAGAPDEYEELPLSQLIKLIKKGKICFFDVEFTNIRPIVDYDNIISCHKCRIIGEHATNNGRVIWAEKLQTSMSSIFFKDVLCFYSFDNIKILNVKAYNTALLPRNLILSTLKFFSDKTSLKGIAGKEKEYMISKNMINSIFGMMVMDVCKDVIDYDIDWKFIHLNDDQIETQLSRYNTDHNRFIAYQWGVCITDYARASLFKAIRELGDDYIYADTDSVFYINPSKHENFFTKYNENIKKHFKYISSQLDIPWEMCCPKTSKGVPKIMGIYEDEEDIQVFKTFGAKRYLQLNNGFCQMTLAGCRKQFAMPYLIAKYNNIDFESEEFQILKRAYVTNNRDLIKTKNYNYSQVFDNFGNGLYIPAEFSGKLTQTYIDVETKGLLMDYQGSIDKFQELSSINLTPQHFSCSITDEYEELISGGWNDEY